MKFIKNNLLLIIVDVSASTVAFISRRRLQLKPKRQQ